MKTLTINTAAGWVATISVPQDGDPASEAALWDVVLGAIGARLGYLKTTVDGKAAVDENNVWVGINEFDTTAGSLLVSGTGDLQISVPTIINDQLTVNDEAEFADIVTFADEVTFSAEVTISGGVALAVEALTDAAEPIEVTTYHARVPVVSAARTYTLPSTTGLSDGHTVKVTRVDTAGFTITIQDPTGPTTVGQITSGAPGWIEFVKRGSAWRVSAWGGTVTALSTTP